MVDGWTMAERRASRGRIGRYMAGAFDRVTRVVRPFLRDRRGGLAPFIAISIIPLIAFIGIGTDAARGYIIKSRLSYALDAAGLAGARVAYSANRDADILMYFNANFPPGYMHATLDGPHFTMNATNEVLTLSATATVGTTFLRVIGIDTMTVAASSEITRQTQLLDLVLVMDVSGSMASPSGGGLTRVAAARQAASDLVDILYGADSIKNLLKIGLVSFNSKVNVTKNGVAYTGTTSQTVPSYNNPITINGASPTKIYTANNSIVPLLSRPPSGWKGCVYARYLNDGDDTDDADISLGLVTAGSKDWFGWEPIGTEGEPVSGGGLCSSAVSHSECTACYSHGITALGNDKTTILNAISQLTNPTGNTNIVQGMFWGWEVLMPETPFTEGTVNPQGTLQRAIVLLTDGEHYGGSGDAYKGVFGIGSAAQPWLDQRLRDLAAAMKAQGVVIYAIQFGDITPQQEALMKEIASGPDAPFYYFAPDSATLQQAFHEIANNLSELRISK